MGICSWHFRVHSFPADVTFGTAADVRHVNRMTLEANILSEGVDDDKTSFSNCLI